MRIRFSSGLLAAFLAVTMVPLIIFWQWPHSDLLSRQLDEVREHHLLLARKTGAELSRYYRDISLTFDEVADAVGRNQDPGSIVKLMERMHFHAVCLRDEKTGAVLGEVGILGAGCHDTVPADRFKTLRALAERGGTVLSGVMPGPSGQPGLYFVQKVGSNLVTAFLDTGYFVDLADRVSFGRDGHSAIVDGAGRILAHPREAWRAEMRDISQITPVKRLLEGGEGTSVFYSPAFDGKMVAGYASVKEPGWGVMVPQPMAELENAAAEIRQSALIVVVIGAVFSCALAILISLLLARSLHELTVTARRMAEGETSARVGEAGGPLRFLELQALKRAFNRMAESVESSSRRALESREKAEAANASKSLFLANVSHELRTPLNAILGFSDMLRNDFIPPDAVEKRQEYLADIHNSAAYLLDLINDVLDLSRIEAGKFSIDESDLEVPQLLENGLVTVKPAASRRPGLSLEAVDETGGARIHADRRAIHQILTNLLSNSVNYIDDGTFVRLTARLADDGALEFVVEDDGPGIPRGSIERLKQPFQRQECDLRLDHQGTGLGLPIVQRLVDFHGGTFVLESDEGLGTCAIVRLPSSRVHPSCGKEAPDSGDTVRQRA